MATHLISLPGEFHGQRSLAGYCPWDCKELDTIEQLTLSLFFFQEKDSFMVSVHAVGEVLQQIHPSNQSQDGEMELTPPLQKAPEACSMSLPLLQGKPLSQLPDYILEVKLRGFTAGLGTGV